MRPRTLLIFGFGDTGQPTFPSHTCAQPSPTTGTEDRSGLAGLALCRRVRPPGPVRLLGRPPRPAVPCRSDFRSFDPSRWGAARAAIQFALARRISFALRAIEIVGLCRLHVAEMVVGPARIVRDCMIGAGAMVGGDTENDMICHSVDSIGPLEKRHGMSDNGRAARDADECRPLGGPLNPRRADGSPKASRIHQ